jgi:hypothetical protein
MGFYKNTIIAFAIQLVILLIIMAAIMANKNKTQEFPPTLSVCADFYSLHDNGTCVTDGTVYSSKEDKCVRMNPKGMSINEKRNWASDCGVAWDGITNSSSI